MFQLAVIGVLAPNARGVVRSCVECRASTRQPQPCNGFGPGCLVAPRPQDAPPASPSSRFSRA
jgi:hypothetical protein